MGGMLANPYALSQLLDPNDPEQAASEAGSIESTSAGQGLTQLPFLQAPGPPKTNAAPVEAATQTPSSGPISPGDFQPPPPSQPPSGGPQANLPTSSVLGNLKGPGVPTPFVPGAGLQSPQNSSPNPFGLTPEQQAIIDAPIQDINARQAQLAQIPTWRRVLGGVIGAATKSPALGALVADPHSAAFQRQLQLDQEKAKLTEQGINIESQAAYRGGRLAEQELSRTQREQAAKSGFLERFKSAGGRILGTSPGGPPPIASPGYVYVGDASKFVPELQGGMFLPNNPDAIAAHEANVNAYSKGLETSAIEGAKAGVSQETHPLGADTFNILSLQDQAKFPIGTPVTQETEKSLIQRGQYHPPQQSLQEQLGDSAAKIIAEKYKLPFDPTKPGLPQLPTQYINEASQLAKKFNEDQGLQAQLQASRGLSDTMRTLAQNESQTKLLNSEIEKATPFYDKEFQNGLDRMDKINQTSQLVGQRGNAPAQALATINMITAMVSGQGSGVRITQPEIQSIARSRGIVGDIEGTLKSWAGQGKLTNTQVQQLQGILDDVRDRVQLKQSLVNDSRNKIQAAPDRAGVISANQEGRQKLINFAQGDPILHAGEVLNQSDIGKIYINGSGDRVKITKINPQNPKQYQVEAVK